VLTVLLPTNSIDNYCREAINSIKIQTFSDFRCLILTPILSNDDLLELNDIFDGDVRFEIHQLKLGGIAFALNYGLNLVDTPYVARMDSDDISHPNRFEYQIKFLEDNESYAVVGSKVRLIDDSGEILKKGFKFFENNLEIKSALRYRMPLCHPALMFRSNALFSVKGYMYGNTAEDHELFLRMSRDKNLKFKNLNNVLFSYRRHNGQLTDIQYAKRAYNNIAGFMFTEFLRTKNLVLFLGIFSYHPYLRRLRSLIKFK